MNGSIHDQIDPFRFEMWFCFFFLRVLKCWTWNIFGHVRQNRLLWMKAGLGSHLWKVIFFQWIIIMDRQPKNIDWSIENGSISYLVNLDCDTIFQRKGEIVIVYIKSLSSGGLKANKKTFSGHFERKTDWSTRVYPQDWFTRIVTY